MTFNSVAIVFAGVPNCVVLYIIICVKLRRGEIAQGRNIDGVAFNGNMYCRTLSLVANYDDHGRF